MVIIAIALDRENHHQIEIRSNNEPILVDTIYSEYSIDSSYISLRDWNFDGYKDLDVLVDSPSGGNVKLIWLYDRNSGKFQQHSGLSSLRTSKIDTVNQKITSFYRGGWDFEEYRVWSIDQADLQLEKCIKTQRWYEQPDDTLYLTWEKKTEISFPAEIVNKDSMIIKKESI